MMAVINDDLFKTETEGARVCLVNARTFIQRLANPSITDTTFVEDIVTSLKKPLSTMCDKVDQEYIWSEFHKVRSSDDYCSKWTSYLSTSNDFHVNPLFYQHITFEIFEALLSNELQGRAQCS